MKSKLFYVVAFSLMGMGLVLTSSDFWGDRFDEVDLGEKKGKKKGLLQRRDPHAAIRPRFLSRTVLEKLHSFVCCCSCKKNSRPLTPSEFNDL